MVHRLIDGLYQPALIKSLRPSSQFDHVTLSPLLDAMPLLNQLTFDSGAFNDMVTSLPLSLTKLSLRGTPSRLFQKSYLQDLTPLLAPLQMLQELELRGMRIQNVNGGTPDNTRNRFFRYSMPVQASCIACSLKQSN